MKKIFSFPHFFDILIMVLIMRQLVGQVLRVFIPNSDVDKMIAFQVETEEGIYEIVQKQIEENANIYKGDIVLLTFQNIDGKEFTSIDLYEAGDLNE